MRFSPTARFGLPALALGTLVISFSPLLVQVSEVGPSTTAVYRALFALPALSAWMLLEKHKEHVLLGKLTTRDWGLLVLMGLFFAGDLIAWHSSIRLSGVANATFLAHLSTPIIAIGAWLMFRERLTWGFLAGLVLAMSGTALVMGASSLEPGGSLLGDGLGVLTAVFYGGYLLTIKYLRERLPSGLIMSEHGFQFYCIADCGHSDGRHIVPGDAPWLGHAGCHRAHHSCRRTGPDHGRLQTSQRVFRLRRPARHAGARRLLRLADPR